MEYWFSRVRLVAAAGRIIMKVCFTEMWNGRRDLAHWIVDTWYSSVISVLPLWVTDLLFDVSVCIIWASGRVSRLLRSTRLCNVRLFLIGHCVCMPLRDDLVAGSNCSSIEETMHLNYQLSLLSGKWFKSSSFGYYCLMYSSSSPVIGSLISRLLIGWLALQPSRRSRLTYTRGRRSEVFLKNVWSVCCTSAPLSTASYGHCLLFISRNLQFLTIDTVQGSSSFFAFFRFFFNDVGDLSCFFVSLTSGIGSKSRTVPGVVEQAAREQVFECCQSERVETP